MAVVTQNGSLYMDKIIDGDPVTDGRADYRYAGGRVHSSLEKITITVTDEATSTYQVARLPKEAMLLPSSSYTVTAAITGDIDLGDVGFVNGLDDAADPSANTQTFLRAWDGALFADIGTPLWEMLGYASAAVAPDQIDLYVTLNTSTQATADAEMVFNFQYTVD